MRICVIGTGYVGLVAGACFAEMGNTVICVDNNSEKIKSLRQGITPIYEPGLEELIKSNISQSRLSFTEDINKAVKSSEVCFITVGTPQDINGAADLQYVYKAAEDIGKAINSYKVIVNKSTVPIGTASKIAEIIRQNTDYDFDIVSNPEFLKQGAAVEDFLKPDRVIIGSDSPKALEIVKSLYNPFVLNMHPIITMDTKSAEMVKYASNVFLAVKISFINEIANICEKTGADMAKVREGMSADKRIGSHFLYHGIGFGGSCFPKDIKALIKTAKDYGCDCSIMDAAEKTNTQQRYLFVDKILNRFNGDIKDKTFAVWGLTFKPNTNDMREAPSVTIINELLKRGAKINAYDPMQATAKEIFKDKINYFKSSYAALDNADALVIITEWSEFRKPDFELIKNKIKSPVIFDGRSIYDRNNISKAGFEYYTLGNGNS